ncbi:MAG: hypothetical protein CMJ62_20935 [Planctomycetaceae bacterium]|nr:hypothetical protein [Planctomycetaceae bacterium]
MAGAAELPAFTDPVEAGPDFLVQGEYVGSVGSELPVGIQVIALGDQQFQGVLYPGGLPGAGWEEDRVFHLQGETLDGATRFHGVHGERLMFTNNNFEGFIRDNVFIGEADMFLNRSQDVTMRLTKVHRKSPTLHAQPPRNAVVLFDGSNVKEWQKGRLVDGTLLAEGTTSRRNFGSLQIHLEFRCPFMPTGRGMQRGNSGLYVKREWEVQIIDSFGWHHENRKFERLSKFGRCAGIHEMVGPRINMAFPPLAWQTYDIDFSMASFDSRGKKTAPAMMTVRHNGVLVHDQFVLPAVSPGADPATSEEKDTGPIFLQDHGNPVRFRNIWIVERD